MDQIHLEPYRALGRAVVVRAILDYQKAKKDLKAARRAGRKQKIDSCKATISECAEFFRSDYCRVLSNIDGREVLKVINKVQLPDDPAGLEALIFNTPRRVEYAGRTLEEIIRQEVSDGRV